VSASAAVSLAREYGEIMRLTSTDPTSTLSVVLTTFFLDTETGRSSPNPTACNGPSVTCTPTELANAAIDDWVDRVKGGKAGLVGGRAEICHTSDPRDASGNLQWGSCNGEGDTVVAKMGWYAKKLGGSSETAEQAWMTADKPRMAIATFYVPPEWARP
jgi:hypothetical protein